MMGNAKGTKEGIVHFSVFPSPIRLNTLYSSIKETLNVSFKLHKNAWCLRSIMHQIYPGELRKVINKTDIVFVSTNGSRRRAPHIRKDKIQRG